MPDVLPELAVAKGGRETAESRALYAAAVTLMQRALVEEATGAPGKAAELLHDAQRTLVRWRRRVEANR